MLGLFRRNLFINLCFLLLFAVLLIGYNTFSSITIEPTWSLPLFEQLFSWLNNKWISIIITLILVVVQAYLLNNLIIRHKMSRALSTIPGAIFLLYALFCLEDVIFHPILLANLFFLLSTQSLFKVYKRHHPVATMFNSGFFLAVAILIYPGYLIFFLLLLLGLFSLRNMNFREVLQMGSGLLLPFFLLWVLLYYQGAGWGVVSTISNNLALPVLDFSDWTILTKGGLVLALIMVALAMQNELKKKKKFDAIKKIELTYWMLFLSMFTVFFINPIADYHFLIISIPIGLIIGMIMETKKNALVKEFVFLLAIGGYVAYLIDLI